MFLANLMYFSVHLLDKIYDQISDAVLDVHLTQDPNAKVASSMIIVCRIYNIETSGLPHFRF
jgi:S-adenosylmethionine synthetase